MLLDDLDGAHVVLVDASSGNLTTVGAIRNRAARICQERRGLVFLLADGSTESATWFLGLLEARHPVALIDPGNAWTAIAGLIDRYRPDMVIDPDGWHLRELVSSSLGESGRLSEPTVWLASEYGPTPHEDLAVLLATSGSTGSPKFVRLSSANIKANAEQIVDSLGVAAEDRGVTVLPLFYSFGMSVITSHAMAGSSILVTGGSVLEESFWSDLSRHRVSYLPGVPATYAMLKRLGFGRRDLPKLRALIQAGGRLAPELVDFFHREMSRRGGRFFVMYGQTEASPRISCLPSERIPEKLGSAGLTLVGGELSIRREDGLEAPSGETGEVIYRGPNVMMGYAESRDDIILGDTHGPVLATGDRGYLDSDGFLYLTGRSKRICKLAGNRVSLDDVENIATRFLHDGGQVAAVDGGDAGVSLFATGLDVSATVDLQRSLARHLRVPPQLITVRPVGSIPLLSSGKIDYAALGKSLDEGGEGDEGT